MIYFILSTYIFQANKIFQVQGWKSQCLAKGDFE